MRRNKALDKIIENIFHEYYSIIDIIFKEEDLHSLKIENNYQTYEVLYSAVKNLDEKEYVVFIVATSFLIFIVKDHMDYIEEHYNDAYISIRTLKALSQEIHKKDMYEKTDISTDIN